MGREDYEFFHEREKQRKKRRAKRLASTDDTGWSKHTDAHWYMMVEGEKLHYWPSANKWLYRGKYYRGGLPKTIQGKIDAVRARSSKTDASSPSPRR